MVWRVLKEVHRRGYGNPFLYHWKFKRWHTSRRRFRSFTATRCVHGTENDQSDNWKKSAGSCRSFSLLLELSAQVQYGKRFFKQNSSITSRELPRYIVSVKLSDWTAVPSPGIRLLLLSAWKQPGMWDHAPASPVVPQHRSGQCRGCNPWLDITSKNFKGE